MLPFGKLIKSVMKLGKSKKKQQQQQKAPTAVQSSSTHHHAAVVTKKVLHDHHHHGKNTVHRKIAAVAPLPPSTGAESPSNLHTSTTSTSAQQQKHTPNNSHTNTITAAPQATSALQTSNPSSSIPKPKKQVRFGHVTQYFYLQKNPPTPKDELYYTPKEVKAIRTQVCALNLSSLATKTTRKTGSDIVQFYHEMREPLDQGIHDCWRGLEHVQAGELLNKLEKRQSFVRAFLYFSQELGVSNSEALAVFSATNSRPDRLRAIELAKQDAFEACHIYHRFLTTTAKNRNNPRGLCANAQAAHLFVQQEQQKLKATKQTTRHHHQKRPMFLISKATDTKPPRYPRHRGLPHQSYHRQQHQSLHAKVCNLTKPL